ncbi:hypothetical protein E4U35_001117 [Claviceps purpurea]|uniref:Related to dnase1 protein n=1 Tax=Claviceps purpurea (strain 20.1) TaxID=1111077 RepID=M1VZ12_CLAP2|nr:hypothetical protein E4U28_002544 [Claviceps purpurea]CCE27736.1 related to dnase1 protein [Claviceps purpurea 20.1]KAG6171195.1 hypothetical protein E4U11_000984 [Claviceps purpurea]KAG6183344.1 hypothetical protein E4U36_002709 [Claviceps purpurea]KAG6196613.1 hypothetical protein E4U10_000817 [Claviceps purpurea]
MRFATSALAFLASAAAVTASSITFWTLDNSTRTIHFTPSEGYVSVPSVVVNSQKKTKVTFPTEKWKGNFYAIQKGKDNQPGMLGEVNFHDWNDMTYFDVSAIVSPKDHHNVKQMWPMESKWPMSGCEVYPCDNAYWLPDDIQTKVTHETDLMTTLGSGSTGLNFAQQQQ